MLTAPHASEPNVRATAGAPLAPSASGWGYRPQLDGLRAVAVYLVVGYHAGSWRLQGGFVGVDLFFVLSGFLVTNVILSDIAAHGTLRLKGFFARRVRRLIPAAWFAIAGTAVISLLVAAPVNRLSWVGDARASSLWFANWHFVAKADDYFRSDDATSPFQHFWSLAVEEQFYLVFPLIFLGAWALCRHRLDRLVFAAAVAVVAGVALQVVVASKDPNRAYLGTDTRAYQLLIGVALALSLWRWRLPHRVTRWAPATAAVALVGFVVTATNLLEVSPSARGLIAGGLAGGLVASLQATSSGIVHRTLSASPIRYLGQISYGTYLWHWPVVVLALHVVDASPAALFAASAVGGTALAALSHALIEHPIRSDKGLNQRPGTVIVAGVAAALVGGILIAPGLLEANRRPNITAAASEASGDGPPQPVPDLDWAEATLAPPGAPRCERHDASDCVVVEGSSGRILLIGDSHARMLMPSVAHVAAARDLELTLAYATSCPWMHQSIPGSDTAVGKDRCIEKQELLYTEQLAAIDPDIVITTAFPYSRSPAGLISLDPGLEGVSMPQLMEIQMRTSAEALLGDHRKLVIIETIPTFEENPLACLSAATDARQCTFTPHLSGAEEEVARALASTNPRVTSLDLDPLICPRLPICDSLQRGYPVWRDSNHLTTHFAEFLGPLLDAELARLGLFEALG